MSETYGIFDRFGYEVRRIISRTDHTVLIYDPGRRRERRVYIAAVIAELPDEKSALDLASRLSQSRATLNSATNQAQEQHAERVKRLIAKATGTPQACDAQDDPSQRNDV